MIPLTFIPLTISSRHFPIFIRHAFTHFLPTKKTMADDQKHTYDESKVKTLSIATSLNSVSLK